MADTAFDDIRPRLPSASDRFGSRALFGLGAVDEWGRDPALAAHLFALSRLRWQVDVGGEGQLPNGKGALIVVNARRFALAPMFAALALADATGRSVSFVGRPDQIPFGPVLQRAGGLLPVASDVAGALTSGRIVVAGAAHRLRNDRVGVIDPWLIAAALAARVRVFPAITSSSPLSRSARLEIGPAVRPIRIRRGALAELELGAVLAEHIDNMLAGDCSSLAR
jgi:hypothetical protein